MREQKHVEMTAAIAVDDELAPRLDMLVGMHPEENRWLSEEEEARRILSLLRFVGLANIERSKDRHQRCRTALLWLKHFPELLELSALPAEKVYEELWRATLEDAHILKVVYAFFPPNPAILVDERRRVRNAAETIHREINHQIASEPIAKGRLTWVVSFPAIGPMGRVVEERSGLSQDLKKGVGLFGHAPGLLCNYLLNSKVRIEQVLDPYQFEELVGILFARAGWRMELTSRSRDGGKDVILTRMDAGRPMVAYIQAKRNAASHTVGISQVKEFVATVAGDGVDRGYLVTTSHFTKPARDWLDTRGRSLAVIELMDREALVSRMESLAQSEVGVYLKTT